MAFITSALRGWLFPVWLLMAAAAAVPAYRSGVSVSLIIMAIGALSFGMVALMERLLPYRPDWNVGRGDLATDATSFGVLVLLADPALKIGGAALALASASLLSLLAVSAALAQMHLAAQLALTFLLAELGKYWAHRLHHELRWLWSFHAMHHSVRRLYVVNNFRLHPFNYVISYALGLFPLAMLGMPVEPMLIYTSVATVVMFFQHANIDLALGPLNYVFSTNVLHRWHHSAALPEGNRNYGSTLMIWDWVFGTFYFPTPAHAPETIGMHDTEYPLAGYGRQLLWPFRQQALRQVRSINAGCCGR